MNNPIRDILKSKASIQGVEFTEPQRTAAYAAMVSYAAAKIDDYRSAESKAVNIEATKLFPALLRGEFKLWLRKRSFIKAKKLAQIRADIENRPVHVVRSSEIGFAVQSTAEVRQLRKTGVYKKEVTAIKMNEVADYTAYPKPR